MKKILIVYYSRTGTTRIVAEAIQKRISCDVEEINTVSNHSGMIRYIVCGKEASFKTPADIKATLKNPGDYDLVIIGTPIWASNISSPVRAYLMQNKGKFKSIACFCTMGTGGEEKIFKEMEDICGMKSVAALAVLTADAGKCEESIEEFIKKLG